MHDRCMAGRAASFAGMMHLFILSVHCCLSVLLLLLILLLLNTFKTCLKSAQRRITGKLCCRPVAVITMQLLHLFDDVTRAIPLQDHLHALQDCSGLAAPKLDIPRGIIDAEILRPDALPVADQCLEHPLELILSSATNRLLREGTSLLLSDVNTHKTQDV